MQFSTDFVISVFALGGHAIRQLCRCRKKPSSRFQEKITRRLTIRIDESGRNVLEVGQSTRPCHRTVEIEMTRSETIMIEKNE